MSENERKVCGSGEFDEREKLAEGTHPGQEKDRKDFSWYGGQVDETVLRNIVRLKREQKL